MFIKTFKGYIKNFINPIPQCYGKIFSDQYDFLNQSQWWDTNRLEHYQSSECEKLLRHCYDYVPYYRNLLKEIGYSPNKYNGMEDLKKLPYLKRDIISKNLGILTATNILKKNVQYETTGGSTGTPIGIYIDEAANMKRLAFEWRFYNWGNHKFGGKVVILRGTRVAGFKYGKRWEYDPHRNSLIMSTFDMTEQNMGAYVRKIVEFKPDCIKGYPSALYVLSMFILENKFKVNLGTIKSIFTSSETLFASQRKFIEEAFSAPIYDLYGNTEQAGIFGECEKHEGYHVFSEHSFIEILNPYADGIGELVATSFINYAMPVIRYKTGDYARIVKRKCSCGRELPIIDRLEGRLQDVAYHKDGTPILLTGFFFAMHIPEMAQIKKLQLIQEKPGELEALVIRGQNYRIGAAERMFAAMNKNLRIDFDIHIQFVSNIETTREGKHRFFIQKISDSRMDS